ncbi:MAG: M23 family metallopeptidase, partial [Jaaginema sp. PMC 1079.18]|nr:M23 family metallopeptidase [Jaaginema sp. PMC 1080.18]MEC4849956.1 M23 family metallopeptidase [Jaaginema sp. PMC 1079.18]MEC4866142.1 M23 family metallopeptidase [Jaaginema sp. PMC 1078.18]
AVKHINDPDLNKIPLGSPLPSLQNVDGNLLKGSGDEIYLMENGVRRHIPDQYTFENLGYDFNAVKHINDPDLNKIPLGSPLPSLLDRLHSNPTESNPLRGFSHPLGGHGTLTQGWHGSKSHNGTSAYALDFGYYFGAPVYAMRSGKVVAVINYFDDNGRDDPSWGNKANLVYIEHDNGYVSRYLHLKKNSVPVQVGDTVSAGQKIGEQGNSGWSTASHLHVAVYKDSQSVPFEIPGVNP